MIQLAATRIHVSRQDANFDRACDSAFRLAVGSFGIDEDGHSDRIPEWERSTCSIYLTFESYRRIGVDHLYIFFAEAIQNEED